MISKVRKTFVHLRQVDLNTEATLRSFKFGVPIFFGLLSVWLGVDANWDLQNYHLYNAFAVLNGKLHIDLAPAGFQSFFNPTLDVPYYLLHKYLPAPLVGFLIGYLHGLIFVLILGIAQFVLCDLPAIDRIRVPILLAIAGCTTGNFLSGLGNTMGDNATAIFVLLGIFFALKYWHDLCSGGLRGLVVSVGVGVLVGLGVGLKLTNAVFAIGLMLAFVTIPGSIRKRSSQAIALGVGTLAGIGITAGWWFFTMWQLFDNPLFPQFSNLFPNELTRPTGIADISWLPKGVLENILWPFVFSLNPLRIGQVWVSQVIWLFAYAIFLIWLFLKAPPARGLFNTQPLDQKARFVVAFVAFGFIAWMALFSIGRYLVSVEVLAPIVVFVLLATFLKYVPARRVAFFFVCLSSFFAVASTLFGSGSWGHERWANPAYRVQLPPLSHPDQTTVVTVAGDPPWAWLIPSFPKEVAFIGLPLYIMDTPAFHARTHKIIDNRSGPIYTIIEGRFNSRERTIAKTNAIAARIGITTTATGCGLLRWVATRFRIRASFEDRPLDVDVNCKLVMLESDRKDLTIPLREAIEKVVPVYTRYGFSIDRGSCQQYSAFIGQREIAYQWCKIYQNKS